VTREWFGAAGAGRQCAPASPVRRGRAAPQLHRETTVNAASVRLAGFSGNSAAVGRHRLYRAAADD
jgi:hypothetical protein